MRLVENEKGVLLPVVDNVVQILRNDPEWADVIGLNEMSGQVMKLKPPPFERGAAGEWQDIDDARLELWLAQKHQLRKLSTDTIVKSVLLAADANRYHEVRDYLKGLKWDGEARVKHWLFAYAGADPTEYAEAVGTKWLIAAVARVMRPGCKVDNVLILEGEQGAGKSTLLKTLFSPWFTDAAFELGSPDGYQIMLGMWCVELAELDGFNRAEASKSKAFFSRTIDRYRNPYGRKPVNVPRTGVFAGSVNHATYLKDDTGNRRYWPVKVGRIQIDELLKDRDQLWAEALKLFQDGVEWWVRASERGVYEQEQEDRYIGDAHEDMIREWLDKPDEGGMKRHKVRTDEVMRGALHYDAPKMTLPEQQRVGRIMKRIGWPRVKEASGGRAYYYQRPEAVEGGKAS